MQGLTDADGYEIRPLKFDRYFVWPVVIFAGLVGFLAWIQSF